MDNNALSNFISNYSPNDFGKIKFDWNGKHSHAFEDKNYSFRLLVSDYLANNDFKDAGDDLIKDLYLEWSKCSKETWGVYNKYAKIAQELLVRGRSKLLYEYLIGACYSFDTKLASGMIKISDELRDELFHHASIQLSQANGPDTQRLWEYGVQRFTKPKNV